MRTVKNEIFVDGPATVVFRKRPDGSVLALFPYMIEGADGHCNSFEHIGQHGSADYQGCIRRTQPATPAEYADVLDELTRIYEYDLIVRRRANCYVPVENWTKPME